MLLRSVVEIRVCFGRRTTDAKPLSFLLCGEASELWGHRQTKSYPKSKCNNGEWSDGRIVLPFRSIPMPFYCRGISRASGSSGPSQVLSPGAEVQSRRVRTVDRTRVTRLISTSTRVKIRLVTPSPRCIFAYYYYLPAPSFSSPRGLN